MKEIIKIFSLYLLGIILLISFNSCEAIKARKEARKDAKAVNRVKADVNLLNDVGRTWLELNPCVNDSTVVTKSDTVTTYDTAYETVHKTDTFTVREQLEKVYITKTVKIRDTIKSTVVDRQKEKILEKDIEKAAEQVKVAQSQTIQAQDKAAKYKTQRNWAYGIIAGMFLLTGLFFFIRSKQKKIDKLAKLN